MFLEAVSGFFEMNAYYFTIFYFVVICILRLDQFFFFCALFFLIGWVSFWVGAGVSVVFLQQVCIAGLKVWFKLEASP